MVARLLIALLIVVSWTSRAGAQAFEAARPWLGVAIEKGEKGVQVKDVLKDTPAAQAGIKAGDQITAVDKTVVHLPEELIKAVADSGVGTTVTVHWLRDGKEVTAPVKLVARPDQLKTLQELLVGKPAPAPGFDSMKVVNGSASFKSADLKGKVTLVEFWATWCPACRSTHKRLSEWSQKHKGRVQVLAISDEDEPTIKEYVKMFKPHFTVLADPQHASATAWMVSAIPEIGVVDKGGNVAFVTIGAGENLEEALATAEKLVK